MQTVPSELSADSISMHLSVQNAACRIANKAGLFRLKQIKSILVSNQDRLPKQLSFDTELPQDHENIRGPRNFH